MGFSSTKFPEMTDIHPVFVPRAFSPRYTSVMRTKKKKSVRKKRLSSLELILLGKAAMPARTSALLRAGGPCPRCGRGKLDYNGLLALECPSCGFVSGEGAGCT
jgi:hypothetical protein